MTLLTIGHSFAYEMECTLRLFYPGEKIQILEAGDPAVADTVTTGAAPEGDGSRRLWVSVRLGDFCAEKSQRLPAGEPDDEAEWALARMLFTLLAEKTGLRPAWGILTGVRPVRLFRRLAAQGLDPETTMSERYLAAGDKIDLLATVERVQRQLLERLVPRGFSLYISIPFCPSRCQYCSFVSHDISGAAKLVPDYVELLCRELAATGQLAARQGLVLQTVYMGGGTPTSLSAEQLRTIMTAVRDHFDCSSLLEYTVEAGRPDTITTEKLAVLRDLGADRVSINPQTMDDGLLAAIGRKHTAAQVEESFALARATGFATINMDLIAGLPGETGAQFDRTLDRVLALGPENVTVHTLTVKRSSHLRERADPWEPHLDVGPLLERAHVGLTRAGQLPYYLYRQKGTVQNLENTGYALPGHEGFYNVLIMEEEQTILAVGAGAVTKLCRPGKPLQRVWGYKYPYEYVERFEEMLRRKAKAEQILEEWS